ncbi:MAG: bifunctional nuclease domain-containing protein [Saprospiraceae bacterium]
MKKLELEIVALSHSVTQSHNYAVVLGEVGGNRRLPIVIGGFEAQAIAVAMERMTPNRPLTHDLFKNTLDTFDIDLKEVIINNLLDGIFYAQLVCVRDGEEFVIDSRTSDAIAMAVRFKSPLYTFDFVMEQAGVVLDETEEEKIIEEEAIPENPGPDSFENYSVKALNQMLKDVLETEDYEKAALIRDEIKKRESGESQS